MKRTILLILLLAISSVPVEARRQRSARPVQPSLFDAIDQIAADALDDGVPGFVIAVSIGDRFLFERAYGVTDRTLGDPVQTDTIFQVASITKQFTASLILKLVERGDLSIDTDIRSILPELVERNRVVTVEHLLTHTSGLPNYLEASFDPHEPVTHADVFEALNDLATRFAPGTRYEYNNSGYYLLGVIIERVRGIDYAVLLEQELLNPLGLVETAYCGRPPAWPIPDGYVEIGPLAPVRFEAMDMSIPFAAGALCSTAEDLVRWSAALHGGRVLDDGSYELMTTNYRLTHGGRVGYGYGIGVGSWNGEVVLSHSGGIPGFSSFLMTHPASGYTIAVVANLFSTEAGHAADIARDVSELFVELPAP